jgi:hypothetical protein
LCLQALEKLEGKPPKRPAADDDDSGSDVSDVELSEVEGSDEEEEDEEARGQARRRRRGQPPPRERGGGSAAVALPAATPAAAAAAAEAPVEEWEVWEPAVEDSEEEWGGQRRGRGRGRGRGRRKKEAREARDGSARVTWAESLPPRQRLAVRALAAAVSAVAAEGTVAGVLRQAQRRAAEAHAELAPAVPDALLVPAGGPGAPEVGVAAAAAAAASASSSGGRVGRGSGGAAGSGLAAALGRGGGPVAAQLAARPVDLGSFLVPSTAPAFEELPALPQYRRNLESHCM